MATNAGKLARLTIDGKEYNVFEANFESIKPVDQWNRVTAFATKADARFVIEGKDDTTSIFEKFANSRKRFDAKLTLYSTHGEGKLVETSYKDCSITYYSSVYNSANEVPYKLVIVLSPKSTVEGNAELTFDQNT
ncbi:MULTISPECIES: type VI secretion system tube protein TssD [Pedobacter]|uniref:Type VI secretion system tube protein TssD n=1 Tax=Pedobacter punctiformis TaxID=3004097 RepID=A0ABT4L3A3_9SPHI|nr:MULTISPECIES: type VI secretion system tube protein TssD [Pedobacter]MCZ4242398.1 type VI secretion system tube protein TssD [Pedobacter sp. HCMS5-2]